MKSCRISRRNASIAAVVLVLGFSFAYAAVTSQKEATFMASGEENPDLPALHFEGAGFKADAEPDGFRGIAWDTPVERVKGLALQTTTREGVAFYARKGDAKELDGAKVSRILYGFYKDRFHCVLLQVKTDRGSKGKPFTAFVNLKKAVFKRYGPGNPRNTYAWGEEYLWRGDKTTMLLSRCSRYGLCSFLIKQTMTPERTR